MIRSLKVLALGLIPASFLSAHRGANRIAFWHTQHEVYRQQAMRMNDLAGHIASYEDARTLAGMFAEEIDSATGGLNTRAFLNRLAMAEYGSVIDPSKRISEQRIANAWNAFVREIGAPDEAMATAAEIHNLRDGMFATAEFFWDRGNQNFWAMPNLEAKDSKGEMDANCRVLEALQILADLRRGLDNLRSARERVKKGELVSAWLKRSRKDHWHEQGRVMVRQVPPDPILTAEMKYQREHGERRWRAAEAKLVLGVLQAESAD